MVGKAILNLWRRRYLTLSALLSCFITPHLFATPYTKLLAVMVPALCQSQHHFRLRTFRALGAQLAWTAMVGALQPSALRLAEVFQ